MRLIKLLFLFISFAPQNFLLAQTIFHRDFESFSLGDKSISLPIEGRGLYFAHSYQDTSLNAIASQISRLSLDGDTLWTRHFRNFRM
ncbi:MAG: hypothetical protein AAF696_12460 [Bacteroidota bacterium]